MLLLKSLSAFAHSSSFSKPSQDSFSTSSSGLIFSGLKKGEFSKVVVLDLVGFRTGLLYKSSHRVLVLILFEFGAVLNVKILGVTFSLFVPSCFTS